MVIIDICKKILFFLFSRQNSADGKFKLACYKKLGHIYFNFLGTNIQAF